MADLPDTCVLVDLLRHDPRALAAIIALDERPCICGVSIAKLNAGAR